MIMLWLFINNGLCSNNGSYRSENSYFILKTSSSTGLKLMIFPPQPLMSWDHRTKPPPSDHLCVQTRRLRPSKKPLTPGSQAGRHCWHLATPPGSWAHLLSSTHLLEVLLGDEATRVCDVVLEGLRAHDVLEFQKHVEKLEDHLHVGRGFHEHVYHLPRNHAVYHVPCRRPGSVQPSRASTWTLCICSPKLRSHPRLPRTHQVGGHFLACSGTSGKRTIW